MKGYKGFNLDGNKLICRDKEYKVGEIAEYDDVLVMCQKGLHFCEHLAEVDEYYSLLSDKNVFAEVEALGEIIADNISGGKCVTNKLKIIRLLSKDEILKIANVGFRNTGLLNTGNLNSGHRNSGQLNKGSLNTGDRNSGNYNSGSRNSGGCNSGCYNSGHWNAGDSNVGDHNTGCNNKADFNTGDYNTGNRNSGCYNSGHWNAGDSNVGDHNTGCNNKADFNTGDYNTGNRNSGNMNTGNNNSGSFNSCSGSSGFFNTTPDKVRIFNIQTNITQEVFYRTIYWQSLNSSDFPLTEMKNGILVKREYKETCAIWWEHMTEENKAIIKSIPYFDANIFKEITGIEV